MPNKKRVNVFNVGRIQITENLILHNFFVSSFTFNLISARKLTQDNKCYLIFSPYFCAIQDLMTSKILVVGGVNDELYYSGKMEVPRIGINKGFFGTVVSGLNQGDPLISSTIVLDIHRSQCQLFLCAP